MADSFIGPALFFQEVVWHESRGHHLWAVLTAIDEHLWRRDLPSYLARCHAAGVTAIPPSLEAAKLDAFEVNHRMGRASAACWWTKSDRWCPAN